MCCVFRAWREILRKRDEMKRLFWAHKQVDLEPQMWYKECVQCDVRTKCAYLYMLCEKCYDASTWTCRSSHSRSAWCMSTFQTFKRDSRSTDLMLNAVACYLFAEKKSSLSVFLHAILPCPATLRPAFFSLICLQTFQFFMYINPFDLLQLMGTMRNTTPPSPPPSKAVVSVFQDNVCVPLSSGRRVKTLFSFDYHIIFVRRAKFWTETLHAPLDAAQPKLRHCPLKRSVASNSARFSQLSSERPLTFT